MKALGASDGAARWEDSVPGNYPHASETATRLVELTEPDNGKQKPTDT
jgi:hypothetical protein